MQKYFTGFKNILRFFKKDPEDDRKWTEKLRDKYRLVVMNDETFEELASFKLTPERVYYPEFLDGGHRYHGHAVDYLYTFKKYIPGYGDLKRDSEVAALLSKSRDLENEIEATRKYSANLSKILAGDHSGMTKADMENQAAEPQNNPDSAKAEKVDRIPEDDALRSAVATGSVSRIATAPLLGATVLQDVPLEQLFFMPPVSGEITSPFDLYKDHFGLDVVAPRNTAIKAAANGTVVFTGYTVETGYTVAIQHPNNVVTVYKHNSLLLKKMGGSVRSGEAIAIIGNTGESSSGPHLHFELWHNGRPVNPADYIIFK